MSDKKTTEPLKFYQGESVAWSKSFPDYSSANAWVLKYYLRGINGKLDITGAADGAGGFDLVVSVADSEALTPGRYDWQSFISKGTEAYFLESGVIQVEASLKSATTHDGRSQVKKTLDAIDAMIEGTASLDQASYTIGTRQLQRIPKTELIKFRQQYALLYEQEKGVDRARKGLPFFQPVNIRFKGPQ